MTIRIDALGKACPTPVILAKKALDSGERDLEVLVDNEMAVQNLTRLAESQGLTASAAPAPLGFAVRIAGEGAVRSAPESGCCPPMTFPGGCTYLIGKDHIGEGDAELGRNLMKMFLYTLAQGETPPRALLFMNGGVRLPAGDEEQVVNSLNELREKGTEILVCGTCLNFFGLTGQLKVGAVSNLYDIVERMQSTPKVISV
ncbi:MAG: sulfurtransferase-like selenium metabolism protein YedF [Clostridia bacterium]|nr:sulfurtransferase-like selenium metabolism protein YedF [Clostridia bacterium]